AAVPRQGGVRARLRPDPPRAGPEDAAVRGARARARRRQGAGAPDRAPGPSDPHGPDQGVPSRRRRRNPPPRRRGVEALARRVPREPLTRALLVLLIAAPAAAAGSGSILASYSFEDTVDTGPDTFAIFQAARHVGTGQGRVSLSGAFHLSGYRPVEIKDVAGTYALTIHREGQETPLVALRDQPNTIRRAGSAVDKFSFVGSPYGDTSSVVYYVDDVVIGTDESVAQLPFVAPGRRKLFVDLFAEYQRQLRERPRCLPLTSPDDVGFSSADLADLGRAGLMDMVRGVFAGDPVELADGERRGQGRWRQVFGAVAQWNAGCQALDAGDARRSL